MAENFLTQDEVDALLNHESVNNQQTDADDDNPSDKSGVRPYNMATQERIVRGRMPTYEIINARFARLLQIGIYNFMRRAVDIAIGPIKTIKYNEFLRTLVVPSNLNMVSMKPLRGTALIVFDPDLIFLIVDNMFGGDGRFHTRVEGREFTMTEQRIIQRLLEVVFEDYEKAWKSVHPIKFEYIRSEMNPQFASVATPSEIVVTTTFELDIGGNRGEFHVCIPYTMFEPIREQLNSSLQGDPLEVDKYWIKSLSRQVQGAEVELVANLGHTQVTLHQILNMQAGDVVPLDILDTVTAQVDGVPVMECHYGILNGHYALKVKTIRSPTETD
ncbi:flagellar motor switch protein FliM [Nitrosomonas halophila]|uniref:Flagellar motor switch protein FliM n=1 Tax=Nitrosomonas halophila TaxID=44576 RepID=A0A1H3JGX2_9PROT|nr:flagellar motor switch protein FliM [Nitrosomonas halophila]SDY39152.1 flagellar motor switch protein FliM [Nitrosomonas halophila]